MTSMLSRAIAALRVWLGFNDPSENHLHDTHGWLLPPVALARARTSARVAILSSADPLNSCRQK